LRYPERYEGEREIVRADAVYVDILHTGPIQAEAIHV